MVQWLLHFAPLLFLGNSLLIGALSAGYSARQNSISSLVHGSLGSWQTANFIGCGILTLILAFYLKGTTGNEITNSHLVFVGAVVLGTSLVLLGLFPTDLAGQKTTAGQLHGAIFIMSVLAQAMLQITVAVTNFSSPMAWYLLASGIITAFGLPAMQLLPDYRGIIQRVFVAAIVLWVTTGAFWVKK